MSNNQFLRAVLRSNYFINLVRLDFSIFIFILEHILDNNYLIDSF
jgi:hypothetical protein